MSRAASTVETCSARVPLRSSQPVPKSRSRSSDVRISAAVSGSGSEATRVSACSVVRQSSGVLSPTPRGSNPTMSNTSRSSLPK